MSSPSAISLFRHDGSTVYCYHTQQSPYEATVNRPPTGTTGHSDWQGVGPTVCPGTMTMQLVSKQDTLRGHPDAGATLTFRYTMTFEPRPVETGLLLRTIVPVPIALGSPTRAQIVHANVHVCPATGVCDVFGLPMTKSPAQFANLSTTLSATFDAAVSLAVPDVYSVFGHVTFAHTNATTTASVLSRVDLVVYDLYEYAPRGTTPASLPVVLGVLGGLVVVALAVCCFVRRCRMHSASMPQVEPFDVYTSVHVAAPPTVDDKNEFKPDVGRTLQSYDTCVHHPQEYLSHDHSIDASSSSLSHMRPAVTTWRDWPAALTQSMVARTLTMRACCRGHVMGLLLLLASGQNAFPPSPPPLPVVPTLDGTTTYCWASKAPLNATTFSPAQVLAAAVGGANCISSMQLTIATVTPPLVTFGIASATWTLVPPPQKPPSNPPLVPSSILVDPNGISIFSSNVAACAASSSCSFVGAAPLALSTPPQQAPFAPSALFPSPPIPIFHASLQFPTPDTYTVFAHVVLASGDDPSIRLDLVVYSTVTVVPPATSSTSRASFIVALVATIVFVLGLALLLWLYRCHRRRATAPTHVPTTTTTTPTTTAFDLGDPLWGARLSTPQPKLCVLSLHDPDSIAYAHDEFSAVFRPSAPPLSPASWIPSEGLSPLGSTRAAHDYELL
ncbi:Aste57867_14981 [Aphanomyces stellatus]|uniref:Aste57867_14981 protein n=1 Tax=Aphanomyces stellatus TaxID=120398 RepID=A0A485L319_9STRA|nr:hypothetical protein As57867_014925 [Aphanomyces stellatus]VFT91795.1 Aste57867_14981 [Aphanomyces stellatus]